MGGFLGILASFGIVDSYTETAVADDSIIAYETMYEDDIESKAAKAVAMQHLDDVVATFAIIFGITFSDNNCDEARWARRRRSQWRQ